MSNKIIRNSCSAFMAALVTVAMHAQVVFDLSSVPPVGHYTIERSFREGAIGVLPPWDLTGLEFTPMSTIHYSWGTNTDSPFWNYFPGSTHVLIGPTSDNEDHYLLTGEKLVLTGRTTPSGVIAMDDSLIVYDLPFLLDVEQSDMYEFEGSTTGHGRTIRATAIGSFTTPFGTYPEVVRIEEDIISTGFPSMQVKWFSLDNLMFPIAEFDVMSHVLTIQNINYSVGVMEHDDPAVQVRPTLTSDLVHVTSDRSIRSVELFDVDGRLLYSVAPNEVHALLDLSDLPPSIYQVRIGTSTGAFVRKVIRE